MDGRFPPFYVTSPCIGALFFILSERCPHCRPMQFSLQPSGIGQKLFGGNLGQVFIILWNNRRSLVYAWTLYATLLKLNL